MWNINHCKICLFNSFPNETRRLIKMSSLLSIYFMCSMQRFHKHSQCLIICDSDIPNGTNIGNEVQTCTIAKFLPLGSDVAVTALWMWGTRLTCTAVTSAPDRCTFTSPWNASPSRVTRSSCPRVWAATEVTTKGLPSENIHLYRFVYICFCSSKCQFTGTEVYHSWLTDIFQATENKRPKEALKRGLRVQDHLLHSGYHYGHVYYICTIITLSSQDGQIKYWALRSNNALSAKAQLILVFALILLASFDLTQK